MDNLFKSQPDFVDFMSQQDRRRRLDEYDQRIAALQAAKEALSQTPVYRLEKKECKSAEVLCRSRGWSNEDAAKFVETFKQKRPSMSQTDKTRVASGLSQVAQAIMMA